MWTSILEIRLSAASDISRPESLNCDCAASGIHRHRATLRMLAAAKQSDFKVT